MFTHGGRRDTGIDAIDWCRQVVSLGAGEILLTSMDRDGTGKGFDLDLLRAACARGARAGDRLGRRRHAAAFRRRARRPGRPGCWPPACSISARSPSRRSKQALAEAGLPVRLPREGGLTMAKSQRKQKPSAKRPASVGRANR